MPQSSDPHQTDLQSGENLTPEEQQFAIVLGAVLAERWAVPNAGANPVDSSPKTDDEDVG